MNTKNVRKGSKFTKYLKGPIKILARARDFYVQSLTGCAGHVAYGTAMGCPTLHPASLPRSFSANSSYDSNRCSSRDEDIRELIRIASTRSLTEKSEAPAAVSRSRTVAIGRIDEDKPCEFGGDDVVRRPLVYPRSRSYAPSKRSSMV